MKEVTLTSSRSSPLQKGRWHLVEGESLSRDSFGPLYEAAYSLPRGGVCRGFLFTEDEIRRNFSYISGTFRELTSIIVYINTFHNLQRGKFDKITKHLFYQVNVSVVPR